MPHPKKPRLTSGANAAIDPPRRSKRIAWRRDASFNDLSTDEIANIFGCLGPNEIMRLRRVSKKWSEAAKKTVVPLTDFDVNSALSYNAMTAMTRALPKMQQIEIKYFGFRSQGKFADGENPNEQEARDSADYSTYDIRVISNFRLLRVLALSSAPLNGGYPCLFNFPLLQKLDVNHCSNLKWDLEMLAGLPMLKELKCYCTCLTGNISSLRVLRNSLEFVSLTNCCGVEGNFMDLSDFPYLKTLSLVNITITGDVREIGTGDFLKLEVLSLPSSVVGGEKYEILRISDAADLIAAIYPLAKRSYSLFKNWHWCLSERSPDWYDEEFYPYSFCFVRAGSRLGWRWERRFDYTPDYCFEVNWLDPEPDKDSSDYDSYIRCLRDIDEDMDMYPFFRGLYHPPTYQVFRQLCRQYVPSREELEIIENL